MCEEIRVICRTNLDYRQSIVWPSWFACRPMIGDWVHSNCGTLRLKIVSITHKSSGGTAKLEVELNK